MININKAKKNSEEILSIEKLSLTSWLILAACLVLTLVGIWQFSLPLLAELHYREGYNLSAAGRYKFAIEDQRNEYRLNGCSRRTQSSSLDLLLVDALSVSILVKRGWIRSVFDYAYIRVRWFDRNLI